MIHHILRYAFHLIVLRPVLYIYTGFNTRNEERLPVDGPAIIVANHNSHFDTFAIEKLLGLGLLHKVRPVAAADYFLSNKAMAWFSQHVLNIIPVKRGSGNDGADPLAECHNELRNGKILIIYPEGSRGNPGEMRYFKKGVAWLAEEHPTVPVIPICIRGLEKVMPRGSKIPLPIFSDVAIGAPHYANKGREVFLTNLETEMHALAEDLNMKVWN